MLVLSRKQDEVVVIGVGEDAIKVKVVSIQGDKVRLGFEAPKTTPINREEVYLKLKEQEALEHKVPQTVD